MKWLGDKPLHTLLLLTEKPGGWATWKLVPIPLLLAVVSGVTWFKAVGEPAQGLGVGLGQLVLALIDWGFLALLPRRGVSFGSVQPPWLGLLVLRTLLSLAVALLATRWPVRAVASLAVLQITVLGLMGYGMLLEPFRVQVSHVEVPVLSTGSYPVHIVQISDLHIERLTRRDRALPGLVAALAPDLIVMTGDYLSTTYQADARALADLRELLLQFSAPAGTYAIWGTQEVDLPDVLRPVFAGAGITLLENRAVDLTIRSQRLWLMGLLCSQDTEAAGSTVADLLAQSPPGALAVLLHHTPDVMPQASAHGVDVVLSGHTHGGQWRIPGFGAILTSSRYWKRYEAGLYREGETYLYVSRGLGMEGFGTPRARFFCPPEIVSIRLIAPRDGS